MKEKSERIEEIAERKTEKLFEKKIEIEDAENLEERQRGKGRNVGGLIFSGSVGLFSRIS